MNSKLNPSLSPGQPASKPFFFVASALTALLFAFVPSGRAVVWDSFQSYADSQVLATNAAILMGDGSSPWTRIGNASANPYAKASYGPYGDTVCHYGLTWSAGVDNDWGIMAYQFSTAQDLTATPGVSVKLMTTSLPPLSNTVVQAEFQDVSGNIWRTKTAIAPVLSAAYSWQTYDFEFNTANMTEVIGTDPFSLTAVAAVRLRFQNDSGDSSAQTVYLDDFQSYQPPQPLVVWDSFQSYYRGQVLATNATILMGDGSSPWTRFGAATSDNPTARMGYGPYLDTACDFPLKWSLGFYAAMAYTFATASNLTSNPGFSVRLLTTSLPAAGNTYVMAGFADASGNLWQTKSTQPHYLSSSNSWQTFAFRFSQAGMTHTAGSGAFDLSAVTQLRIYFQNNVANTAGDATGQHVYLDTFGAPLARDTNNPSLVWETFQAYTNGEVLASASTAQPTNAPSMWGYFGSAAADKLYAKTGVGPSSDTVGDYPIKYSLGTSASLLNYFGSLSNLTTTPGFTIKALVNYLTAVTNTLVYGQFEQTNANITTNTIWQTTAGVPMTATSVWQTLTFNFSPATMIRAQGTNDFDLTAVRDIRIKFANTGGDATSQHAYVTDLESYPAKPLAAVVPRPSITGFTFGAANTVTLQFTSSDNSDASNFQLWWSPALGPSANWQQDTGATITSIGTGLYQVTTTGPAGNTFYRIRH